MRRMRWTAIGWFTLLAGVVLAAALASAWHGAGLLPGLGDFRGIIITGAAMFLTYLYAIVALRALLAFAPLHAGAIEAGSRQEFRYQVYILSYLFLFNALLHCRLIPISADAPGLSGAWRAHGRQYTLRGHHVRPHVCDDRGQQPVGGGHTADTACDRRDDAGALFDCNRKRCHDRRTRAAAGRRNSRRWCDHRGQCGRPEGRADWRR